MESEKNLLKKVTALAKSKRRLLIFLVIFICVLISVFFLIRKPEKLAFYPISNAVKIKPIIKMFSQKDYYNLTSYVDNIASSLNTEERKIALFYKAESYFIQQKYNEARDIFAQLAAEFPTFWQVNFRTACIYLMNKQYQEAETYFNRVKVDLEEINYWKGIFYHQQGRLDEALPYFKKSLSYPDAIFYTAEILKSKSNGLESLSYYITLYDKYPEYKQRALLSIIEVYEKNKDHVQLLKYLEIYEKMNPTDLEAKKRKGFALYAIGKKEEAYKTLAPIALIKKDMEILRLLAGLAYEMNRFNDAVNYFEKIEMNREDKKKYIEVLMMAHLYEKAAQTLEAFRTQERIETITELSEIFHKLVECYLQLDKLETASKTALYLISIEDTADNYILLAKIYKTMGRNPDYLSSLQKATEKEPKYLNQFLESLLDLGAPEHASLVLENILRKNPYQENALFYKAKLEYQRKNNDKAKAILYTLIYLPPKDKKTAEEAGFMLGSLLIKEEKYDEAEKMFREAVKANSASVKANLKLASLLIRKNGLKEAKQILDILKSQNLQPPLMAVTYQLLSSVEEKLGDYEKSAYYKKRAMELNAQK